MKMKKEVLEVACKRLCYFLRDNPGRYKANKLVSELGIKGMKNSSHVREVVHELRIKGIPVCSSSDGYWLGQTDDEITKCIGRLTARAISIWNAARNMMRVVQGQISMEQIIDEAFPLGKEDADV